MRRALPLLALLLGCHNDKDGGGGNVGESGLPSGPALVLTLDSDTTRAGESVGYTLSVVQGDETTSVSADSLSSDLEATLSFDDQSVSPTLAGDHTLTAVATWEGEALEATAALVVTAGAATSLDLTLDGGNFVAGDSLGYAVTATDAYGNAVDTSDATLTPSSDDVTASSGLLSGTVAGSYSLTASLDGASDLEYFQILAGPAETITLTLSDTDLEVGDSTTALVQVEDAYGNAIDDDYTLSVDGSGTTVVDGDQISFPEEGWYTVTATTADGTELSDSVGPLLVDSTGPELVIDSPERGSWSEEDTGTVSGTVSDAWSDVSELTVNGAEVDVGSDGSFSTDVGYTFGLNVLSTEAMDGDGNLSTDTRSVLEGSFASYGATAPSAMVARMNEGEGGLDELEVLGEGLVESTDLDALIPYPAYSYSQDTCIDYWFGKTCWTWYSVKLYITSPSIGSTDLQLDPKSTGQLQASFTVNDPHLNWSASGTVVGISYSGSGTISADSITATLLMTPYVSGGNIGVTVDSVAVSSSGFDFDFDSWLYDALDYIGVDIDGMVRDYMEQAISDVVYDEVPAVVGDALQDLEIGYSFDLADNTYQFLAVPDSVGVDETGITLGLGTTFSTSSWTSSRTGLGSLYYGYAQPTWVGDTGTQIGVSADFLNQVFYAMWGGGLLNQTLTDEDLGLDVADLALVLPGLTDLTVTTEPLLPPVVIPGKGDDLLKMEVGDLLVTIYDGEVAPDNIYMQVYVTAEAGLDLTATSSATLSATLGTPDLYFDVVYPDANSAAASSTEDLLTLLVPLLLPELTSALGEIAIPEIEGFGFSDISVTEEGADSGYTVLSGQLSAE